MNIDEKSDADRFGVVLLELIIEKGLMTHA